MSSKKMSILRLNTCACWLANDHRVSSWIRWRLWECSGMSERISIKPDVCNGRPVVRGTASRHRRSWSSSLRVIPSLALFDPKSRAVKASIWRGTLPLFNVDLSEITFNHAKTKHALSRFPHTSRHFGIGRDFRHRFPARLQVMR